MVDTSVWYAALDRSDRSHPRAADVVGAITDGMVTDHILVETHRLADHRLGRTVADTFLETLLTSGITIELVGRADLEHAVRIRATFPDRAFSLVDCTSFSVMERLGVTEVATFDVDFSIY
ncbi:MAG TPA: PIN domain-containing protein, partial [Acidimicrobiia bacterium]|nr:PIN domain-containing protein [Acidimicrobiia bacterium]